jgi:hypothetical protein
MLTRDWLDVVQIALYNLQHRDLETTNRTETKTTPRFFTLKTIQGFIAEHWESIGYG